MKSFNVQVLIFASLKSVVVEIFQSSFKKNSQSTNLKKWLSVLFSSFLVVLMFFLQITPTKCIFYKGELFILMLCALCVSFLLICFFKRQLFSFDLSFTLTFFSTAVEECALLACCQRPSFPG